nr:MAG TPA: hypothetical protein [Caudoviricetes sp.]
MIKGNQFNASSLSMMVRHSLIVTKKNFYQIHSLLLLS